MEKHPEPFYLVVVERKDGTATPFNAGDAVAAAVDVCKAEGIPLAPSIKARLGKGAKVLLENDFDPRVVVAACVTAIRTGWFGSVESIAQEIVVARAGQHITRERFKQALEQTTVQMQTSENPVWQTMREDAARRAERIEQHADQ